MNGTVVSSHFVSRRKLLVVMIGQDHLARLETQTTPIPGETWG
jgi:hypothetical protein